MVVHVMFLKDKSRKSTWKPGAIDSGRGRFKCEPIDFDLNFDTDRVGQ